MDSLIMADEDDEFDYDYDWWYQTQDDDEEEADEQWMRDNLKGYDTYYGYSSIVDGDYEDEDWLRDNVDALNYLEHLLLDEIKPTKPTRRSNPYRTAAANVPANILKRKLIRVINSHIGTQKAGEITFKKLYEDWGQPLLEQFQLSREGFREIYRAALREIRWAQQIEEQKGRAISVARKIRHKRDKELGLSESEDDWGDEWTDDDIELVLSNYLESYIRKLLVSRLVLSLHARGRTYDRLERQRHIWSWENVTWNEIKNTITRKYYKDKEFWLALAGVSELKLHEAFARFEQHQRYASVDSEDSETEDYETFNGENVEEIERCNTIDTQNILRLRKDMTAGQKQNIDTKYRIPVNSELTDAEEDLEMVARAVAEIRLSDINKRFQDVRLKLVEKDFLAVVMDELRKPSYEQKDAIGRWKPLSELPNLDSIRAENGLPDLSTLPRADLVAVIGDFWGDHFRIAQKDKRSNQAHIKDILKIIPNFTVNLTTSEINHLFRIARAYLKQIEQGQARARDDRLRRRNERADQRATGRAYIPISDSGSDSIGSDSIGSDSGSDSESDYGSGLDGLLASEDDKRGEKYYRLYREWQKKMDAHRIGGIGGKKMDAHRIGGISGDESSSDDDREYEGKGKGPANAAAKARQEEERRIAMAAHFRKLEKAAADKDKAAASKKRKRHPMFRHRDRQKEDRRKRAGSASAAASAEAAKAAEAAASAEDTRTQKLLRHNSMAWQMEEREARAREEEAEARKQRYIRALYIQNDLSDGKITMEQAKQELEGLGYKVELPEDSDKQDSDSDSEKELGRSLWETSSSSSSSDDEYMHGMTEGLLVRRMGRLNF